MPVPELVTNRGIVSLNYVAEPFQVLIRFDCPVQLPHVCGDAPIIYNVASDIYTAKIRADICQADVLMKHIVLRASIDYLKFLDAIITWLDCWMVHSPKDLRELSSSKIDLAFYCFIPVREVVETVHFHFVQVEFYFHRFWLDP